MQILAGARMGETQLGGMERQTRSAAAIGDDGSGQRLAVHFLAANGMSGFGQVDADLVGSPGL